MFSYNAYKQHPKARQTGATLVISLLLLIVLTILGLTTMNTVTMQERMSGNFYDHNLAFQSAEAGLRDAELWILTQFDLEPTDDGSNNVWEDGIFAGIDMEDQDASWWASNGIEYGSSGSTEMGTYADPYYVIEFTGKFKDGLAMDETGYTSYYRITSRAVGGSENAVSVIQSSYAMRFN